MVMLQPALGSNKDAELQIKYNYSSQSTLQFEAMSQDYLSQESLHGDWLCRLKGLKTLN
ncbi:hypothetical protein HRED_10532 [Candidatus Haloredivivus sp. G17]|nr:hypothetical protein HRED_10532 [Candidatus Haloredivivus sp. G17]